MIKENKLALCIGAALTAGVFSIVPAAYAMPQATGTNATANQAAATIATTGNTMDIQGKTQNNILNWDSFSIAKGETVQFDGGNKTNNYLNLVNGTNMSEIYGTMKGGNNVYLINPNGILFGAGAQVNVGHLIASTRTLNDANLADFAAGKNPITNSTATEATGDIVNMGKLQASSVVLEGKDVRIINTADLTDGTAVLQGADVTIKASREARIGYDTDKTTNRDFSIGDKTESKTVQDYATTADNQTKSATTLKWTVTALDGTTAKNGYDYMRVNSIYDLQNMDANLSGNYILAGDIDASKTATWNYDAISQSYLGFSPVGNRTNRFQGAFDGFGHTINGLMINRPRQDYVGLFGSSLGAISNLGLVKGTVTGNRSVGGVAGGAGAMTNVYNTGDVTGNGNYVGGVAGSAGAMTNVYNKGTVNGSGNFVGGVVGTTSSAMTNVYNTGDVTGTGDFVGGVVGKTYDAMTNAYNKGTVKGTGTASQQIGGVVGFADLKAKLTNVYNTGDVSGVTSVGGVAGETKGTLQTVYNTGDVTGSGDSVGGVVGETYDAMTDAYNKGTVKGTGTASTQIGGVAGKVSSASAKLTNVYNTGAVSGATSVGGVAGETKGTLQTVYNTGDVTGSGDSVGGVVGETYDAMTDAYNKGTVKGTGTASTQIGGVAGKVSSASAKLTNVYNTGAVTGTGTPDSVGSIAGVTTATITNAAYRTGSAASAAGGMKDTGFTNVNSYTLEQMKQADTYKDWTDFSTNWRIYDGYTTPLLRAFLTKITVSSTGLATPVYNGQAQQLSAEDLSYSSTVDMSKVWETAQATQTNAGRYSLANMLYSSQDGYDFTSTDFYTIAPKTITATVTGSVTKTYDGTTTAAALGNDYQLTGLVGQDRATLTSAAGTYNSKDVATADTVTYGGLKLSNTNYTLGVTSITGAGTITAKTITASLHWVKELNKVYDGSTSSDIGTNYDLNDVLSNDTVHLTATGNYDSKNAGLQNVTYTNLKLDNGNYQLASTATSLTGMGTITPKTITATLTKTTGLDKVYDGNASSALGTNYAFGTNDIVSGDTIHLTATGNYDSQNAGDRNVTYNNLKLDNGNYQLADTITSFTGTGKITPKTITATLTNTTGLDKVYDGNASSVLGTNYAFGTTDIVSGDAVHLTATGSYDSLNAGAQNVTFSGLKLDNDNYQLGVTSLTGTGKITPKTITATLTKTTGLDKIYDGNASSALGTNYAFGATDIVSGDTVHLTASGSYDSKNAGAQNVTFSGLKLDNGNYQLGVTSLTGTGTITPKTITATLTKTTGLDKVYDGNASSALGTNYAFGTNDIVSGDTVNLSATGSYDSKNVTDAKNVTYTNLKLDNGNYQLADTVTSFTGTGAITPKTITAAVTGSVTKTYDGTTDADKLGSNYQLTGFIGQDSATLTSAAGTYNSNAVNGANTVTYGGLSLDNKNYTLGEVTSLTGAGTITPKTITATLTKTTGLDKVYDGNASSALGSNYAFGTNDIVSGDTIHLTATGSYDSQNVMDAKNVTYTNLKLDNGNYQLADTVTSFTGTGKITPKTLAAQVTGSVTKVYDGTKDAAALGSNYQLTGFVGTDKATLTSAAGTYNSQNVNGANTVTYGDLSLDNKNYTLGEVTSLTGAGTITPKTITASLSDTVTKIYDGTTQADAFGSHYVLDDVLTGDTVNLSEASQKQTGIYNSKNVKEASTVQYSGLQLAGSDAGNYTLASTSISGTGKITPKTIQTIKLVGTIDKTDDTTNAADLGNHYQLGTDVLSGDVVLLSGEGHYEDAIVGDNKKVSFQNFQLTGTDGANYALPANLVLSGYGSILKKGVPGENDFRADRPQDIALNGWYHGVERSAMSGLPFRIEPMSAGYPQLPGMPQEAAAWYRSPLYLELTNGGISLPGGLSIGSSSGTTTKDLWDGWTLTE
ncbi:MAG: YDG domain-containing protein [Selenomonas sp.]|nr:YDG domain-containing protein [Selenomonas sp.]